MFAFSGMAPDVARRSRWALLLVAVVLWSGTASARNVALLVGVGKFSDPQLQAEQLLGPAADIESLQQSLTGRWGFEAKDVRVLRDKEATHDGILAEISALEGRSAPGDVVLIYFSGHGTSANADENTYDLPYATGAWVPYDLDFGTVASVQRGLIIGRRDLVPRLKRLDDSGRWVVVVSDSCYSGQVVRSFGARHSHTRYLAMTPRDLGVARAPAASPAPVVSTRPAPPPYPYQHVVLLSGASDSETGADISSPQDLQQSPTLDGKFHGAFTDALLRLLNGQLLDGPFNYAQGREAMLAFLEHRSFAQHPQLLPGIAEDPQDVGSSPFLKPPQPTEPSSAITAVSPATPPTYTLHVRLQGVSDSLRHSVAELSGVKIVERDPELTLLQTGDTVRLMGPAGDPIVTLPAGDPGLLKRLAAQVWTARMLPADANALGLRAETNPASRGNTFVQCESFTFEVSLRRPAYIMLIDLDPQGGLTVLYPTRPSERRLTAAGAPIAIPGADPKDRIVVTPPFGTDQVTVLAFEKAPQFFPDLNSAERFETDSKRAAALAKGLALTAGPISVQHVNVNTYASTNGSGCRP